MKLVLYNTESRQKETLTPSDGRTFRLYTCGPTVYNVAHIGNFRTYIFEDIVRRTLKAFGYKVNQVMNITDVDDKTIKGCTEKGLSLEAYTAPFKKAFFEDLDQLNVERADRYVEATDYIDKMIEMIKTLLNKGIAYQGQDGSIYYSLEKFKEYGRLSHLKKRSLKKGASNRVDDEYEKGEASDFVLWKAFDPKRDGEVFWESPFGKGRPGWHIECSAMAVDTLGMEIDLHMGGVDNIFPHHDNEIAQSEGCYDKRFCHHWAHAEHLLVDGKKMAKSAQNFYTLRDLIKKGYFPREVRYLLLQTHYKTQLNFTLEGLMGSRATLQRLDDFCERLQRIKGRNQLQQKEEKGESKEENEHELFDKEIGAVLKETKELFFSSLADDLMMPQALAALFDMVRKINGLIDKGHLSPRGAEKILSFLKECDAILAVLDLEKEEEEIPLEIQEALKKREVARVKKEWETADKERDFIVSKGFFIEDTPSGPTLKKRG